MSRATLACFQKLISGAGLLVTKKHPLVKKAHEEGRPWPLNLGLFLDGTSFTSHIAGRAQSVDGVWIINLITGTRYYYGGLRTGEMCRCGCRGWCSVWVVLRSLKHALKIIASGVRPLKTWRGEELAPSDPLRILYDMERGLIVLQWSSLKAQI